MRTLWTWSVVAALVVGFIIWGVMFWAMVFHRKHAGDDDAAAAPDPVQPAARDRVHRRPDDHRGGAVRVHRAVVQNNVERPEPAPELKVDVVAFQWNWQFAYPDTAHADGCAGHHDRHVRHDPAAGAARRTGRSSSPSAVQRRDPQLLRAGVPLQARRLPVPGEEQPAQHLADRADRPRGRLRRPVRGAVRRLPRGDELRGPGAARRTCSTGTCSCARRSNPATSAPYTAGEALQALNCGEWCAPAAITTYPFKTNRTVRSASAAAGRQLSREEPDEDRVPDLRDPDDLLLRRRAIVYLLLARRARRHRRAVPHRRPVADRRHLLPVRLPPPGAAAGGQPRGRGLRRRRRRRLLLPGQLLAVRAGRCPSRCWPSRWPSCTSGRSRSPPSSC